MKLKISKLLFIFLILIMVVAGVLFARFTFLLMVNLFKARDSLIKPESEPLNRTAFSFKRDISSFFANCGFSFSPDVRKPLHGLYLEFFEGKQRYKGTVTIKASLHLPKGLTNSQIEIVEDFVIELERESSQDEKQRILETIKGIVGPEFGGVVSVEHSIF